MRFGKHTLLSLLPACLAISTLLAAPAHAQTLVIGGPGDLGSGNSFPFTVSGNGQYQQVYNSALFSGSFNIGSLSFYNNNYQPGTAVIDTATYDIHLSTTSRPVNGLDTSVFANNIGPDDMVFFNGTLGGAVGPSNIFTIVGGPFLYNPANGNLLIDITKTNDLGDGNGYLDANNGTFGTDSSRAHNFGGGFESFGLVTGFTAATAVPEPGSVALLAGMGLSGAGFLARRRKNAR